MQSLYYNKSYFAIYLHLIEVHDSRGNSGNHYELTGTRRSPCILLCFCHSTTPTRHLAWTWQAISLKITSPLIDSTFRRFTLVSKHAASDIHDSRHTSWDIRSLYLYWWRFGKRQEFGICAPLLSKAIDLLNSAFSTETRMTKSSWLLPNSNQYRSYKGVLMLWVYHKVYFLRGTRSIHLIYPGGQVASSFGHTYNAIIILLSTILSPLALSTWEYPISLLAVAMTCFVKLHDKPPNLLSTAHGPRKTLYRFGTPLLFSRDLIPTAFRHNITVIRPL